MDDVVAATIATAEHCRGCELLNIARGTEISILDLAHKIVAVSGSSSKVTLIEPPPGRYDFEVDRRTGDSSKLERLTGLRLSTSLDEGLKKTLASMPR